MIKLLDLMTSPHLIGEMMLFVLLSMNVSESSSISEMLFSAMPDPFGIRLSEAILNASEFIFISFIFRVEFWMFCKTPFTGDLDRVSCFLNEFALCMKNFFLVHPIDFFALFTHELPTFEVLRDKTWFPSDALRLCS